MTRSEQNLTIAFAGESQANRKYLAFAQQAEREGLEQAARMFRAAAAAETVHAHNHLRALRVIRTTRENLAEAIEGETREFKDMYPGMIAEAEAEGAVQALLTFRWANEVERVHAELYRQVLASLENQENYCYWVCSVCGHTVPRGAPDACGICGAPANDFVRVE